MIKNYLLTALRNIFRNKRFSLLNIFGLSISMSVCMLIIVIILDQLSYDQFHTKKDRIYRIQTIDSLSNVPLKYASTTFPLGYELANNYPFVEKAVILNNSFYGEARKDEDLIEINGLYASENFFEVFDFPLKNGTPEDVLKEPYTVVLKEEVAKKFFGDEDPRGKFLQIDSVGDFLITGVVEQTKKKSHIQFEALVSATTLEAIQTKEEQTVTAHDWTNYWSNHVYLLLYENADLDDIQRALDEISIQQYKDDDERNVSFCLQPLKKIVPGPLLANEMGFFLPKVFILFMGGLALVIIISAAFNYTSLSIARSLMRAREVGVRKTVGAQRNQVIIQFLFEAILISLFSLVVAYVLLQLLLPGFTGMKMMSLLEIQPEQNVVVYIWFLAFALLTGFLSGILPSVVISAFKPVYVLKGIANIRFFSKLTLRKILLITQFVFSMVFIISILLIFKQMNFMINAEMGFDRDIVFSLYMRGHDMGKVKNQYSRIPEIEYISAASHIPGIGNFRDVDLRINKEDEKYSANCFYVDKRYVETMGLELLAGKTFPEDLSDENENFVIINEKTIEHFNLGDPLEAIGTSFICWDSTLVEVIGVVKDYYYGALFMPLKPLIIWHNPGNCRYAIFRVHSGNMVMTVDKIKKQWREIDPYHEMEGDFLDAEIREYYSFFEDILYTVGFAAILAIVIAGFGLLGMATYSIQTRLKEIGIRKALGANATNIMTLVTRSYLIMMLIAAVIGGPIAYMVNNLWLQYLANHVSFGAGLITIGMLIVILVGLVTISSQTFKASRVNPARILKYE